MGMERKTLHSKGDSAGAVPRQSDSQVSILDSAKLFEQGASEVRIVHRGQEYRLRITRQGKLILTK